MNKAIVAFLFVWTVSSIDARAQASRPDTTFTPFGHLSSTGIGVGLQSFPLPGIGVKMGLGRFMVQISGLPPTPGVVPGEAFVGARVIRNVYHLSMVRFFLSGGYGFNFLIDAPPNTPNNSVNQYGFGSAGAEWISTSGLGVSLEAVVSIMGRPQFMSNLLPAGLGVGLHYYF